MKRITRFSAGEAGRGCWAGSGGPRADSAGLAAAHPRQPVRLQGGAGRASARRHLYVHAGWASATGCSIASVTIHKEFDADFLVLISPAHDHSRSACPAFRGGRLVAEPPDSEVGQESRRVNWNLMILAQPENRKHRSISAIRALSPNDRCFSTRS